MVLDVERQQIVAEHPVENLVFPGTDAEHFRIRPRDVPELGHHQIVARVFEHPRQKGEVIVLHEHHCRSVADLVQNGIGELAVDALIIAPIVHVEARTGVGNVTQRPKRVVGKAVVVPLLFLLAEPYPAQGIGRIFGRDKHPVQCIDRFPIGGAAAVGNPYAAAGAHHRVECRGQTARRSDAMHFVVFVDVDEWLAIGDHDEFRVAEPLEHYSFQSFSSPIHVVLLCVRCDVQRAKGSPSRPTPYAKGISETP